MAYRDDGGAREAKRAALASQLDDVRRGRAVDGPDEEALKREITALALPQAKLIPPLGLLSRVRIASPCTEDWNAMVGDARVRRCTRCERDVYNLSGFTSAEAEALLSREGEAPCVRLYRRKDGTIMTSDCVEASHRKLALKVLAASACALALGGAVQASQPEEAPLRHSLRRGEPVVRISGFNAAFENALFDPCTEMEGETVYQRILRESECHLWEEQSRYAMGGLVEHVNINGARSEIVAHSAPAHAEPSMGEVVTGEE